MANAPGSEKLPCHRVLSATGALAPSHAFSGKEYQRMLLEMEGVSFTKSGRVDLKKHLWKPTPTDLNF